MSDARDDRTTTTLGESFPPAASPVVSLRSALRLLTTLLGARAAGVSRLPGAACPPGLDCTGFTVQTEAGEGTDSAGRAAIPAVPGCAAPFWIADASGDAAPDWLKSLGFQCFAAVPLRYEGGEPFACLWVADDKPRDHCEKSMQMLVDLAPILVEGIALARRYEDTLLDTSQKLQALYNASADGILMVDANLRISVANRRFGEFFGLDPVQVIGMDDNDVRLAVLGCFKDPEGFQKRVGELYSDPGAEGEDEVELARPVPRILQRSSGPVRDPRGLVLGRLWIFRDVTARLRMERELEEKARLIAESDRLKSQFLATTSHELRTPLNSLLGFLKLILEGVCETPEEERSLISYAYNTGTHLATLLNDILDLAKIESGSVPLNMDWIEIGKLLGEVLPICAVQAQAKSISCEHSELPADLPLVNADYLRLRQVMLNLIGNAIKYTATGGVRLEIDWSPGSPSLSLRVTDTGIGMDSAVLAGARTGEFTSRTRRGVGSLGLSIARRYLALMGGSLDLASPGANEGTTARITLQARPCDGAVRERESSGNSPRPRAALAAGLAVLVVEDDLPSAQAVRMALERLGNYKVTESEDVARILALARTGEIEAILMDVSLSRSRHEGRLLDGLEITRMLKADELTRHIPVVLMTAHAMAGDRERMLRESGADAYESKPILDFHSLMARLAALVRRAAD